MAGEFSLSALYALQGKKFIKCTSLIGFIYFYSVLDVIEFGCGLQRARIKRGEGLQILVLVLRN